MYHIQLTSPGDLRWDDADLGADLVVHVVNQVVRGIGRQHDVILNTCKGIMID